MVPVSSQSPGIGWETDLLCNFYMTYMAKSYYIRYIKVEKTLKSTSPFSYFFLMWLLENLKWYPVHLVFLLATAVPEIQCLEPCLCLQATMFTKGPQLTCRCPDHLGLPGGSAVKNPPANAGDMGLIPGLRRMATHSSILAWRIPWTEEPGGLQSMEVTKSQPWLSIYVHQSWPFESSPSLVRKSTVEEDWRKAGIVPFLPRHSNQDPLTWSPIQVVGWEQQG